MPKNAEAIPALLCNFFMLTLIFKSICTRVRKYCPQFGIAGTSSIFVLLFQRTQHEDEELEFVPLDNFNPHGCPYCCLKDHFSKPEIISSKRKLPFLDNFTNLSRFYITSALVSSHIDFNDFISNFLLETTLSFRLR